METFFPDLLMLADYTNVASILVILCCSVGMTLFIYFFGWTGDLTYRTVDFGPQQRNMVKVSNPFVLELDQNTKELGDVLRLSLSTLCPCHVVVVWGPKIQAFHDLILMPGRTVRKQILTASKQNTDLQPLHSDVLQLADRGKHTIALPTPESVSSEALGDMPRSRYPLAVFVFTLERGGDEHNRLDNDDDEIEQDNSIIGLFAIVHLKDDTVTKDSHIIGKYVKTAGVPIYSLQALFASTTDQPQDTSSPSHSDKNLQSQQCTNESHQTSTSAGLRQRNTQNPSDSASTTDQPQDTSSPSHSDNLQSQQCTNESHQPSTSAGLRQRNTQNPSDSAHSTQHDNSCSKSNHEKATIDRDSESENPRTQNDSLDFSHSHNANLLGESDSIGNNLKVNDCVVCQMNPAKCALLPCRHKCVCLRCLKLLDRCPLCRGVLESYFIVASQQDEDWSEDEDEDEEEQERVIRQGVAAQFENMFERVNHLVGFA